MCVPTLTVYCPVPHVFPVHVDEIAPVGVIEDSASISDAAKSSSPLLSHFLAYMLDMVCRDLFDELYGQFVLDAETEAEVQCC